MLTAMEAASSKDPGQGARVFRCSVLHCGKIFNRKEHLHRHVKSHNPHPPHECRICGRRYARSDVLKRHVENHPANPHPRQPRLPPCSGCLERKTRCTGGTPCHACTKALTTCTRPSAEWQPHLEEETETAAVPGDDHDPGLEGLSSGSHSSNEAALGQALFPDHEDGSSPTRLPGQSISPADPDPLATPSSSEQGAAMLALDPTAQYPWLASDVDIYQQEDMQPDLLSMDFTGQASSLGGTKVADAALLPTAPIQNGHPSAEAQPLGIPGLTGSLQTGMPTGLNAGLLPGSVQSPYPLYNMLPSGSAPIFEAMQDPLQQWHDANTVGQLVESYFREVHPCWPILHRPTFDITKCSPILKRSVLILGSLASNGLDHLALAPVAVNTILAAQPLVQEQFIPLETLQAMLLCLVYCVTHPGRGETVFGALRLHGYLIAALRCQQVFSGMHDLRVEGQLVEQDGFRCWVAHEALNRLAYACLRVDAYLSILLDQPPSVRYFELTVPLPKLASLWSARTAEERSELQWSTPAGRESALFCNILRDGLDDEGGKRRCYPLTGQDYHLCLCALQVGVWEAAREAHSLSSDELCTKLGPGGPIYTWRRHLDFWRRSMKANGRFAGSGADSATATTAVADDEEPFAPMTQLLWYVSYMKMHAPIANLQASAALSSKNKRLSVAAAVPGANLGHFDFCARIRVWVESRCARVACWNAAQIARVVRHEAASPARAQRLRLNPLAGHALFMAAIVVVSYAFYFASCGCCTIDASSGMLMPAVDLFESTEVEGDAALHAWWDENRGYAVLGPNKLSLCRCQFDDLIAWLRTELASMDPDLETSFVAFTQKLKVD